MPRCAPLDAPKAKLSAAMLGIGTQTLRYWRDNLDPAPHKGDFSAGRLLAYRVLNVLIRQRFIPVEYLKRCDWVELFESCEHVALSVLARSYLYIDVEQGILFLHNTKPFLDEEDLDAQVIALNSVVALHRAMLESMGSDGSQRRYHLTPSKSATTSRRAPIIRRKERPDPGPYLDLSVLDDCD